jgi:hypothetical protein
VKDLEILEKEKIKAKISAVSVEDVALRGSAA